MIVSSVNHMTVEFPQDQPISAILPAFYKQYNLEADGGYDSDHVTIEFTRNITLYIPNWDARRKALLKHDVHHIVTGYKSNFLGETEIAAWEIGSGCWQYGAALALNMPGLAIGFWINLPKMFRAFVLGVRTRNLYSDMVSDTDATNMTVLQIREMLGLNASYPRSVSVKEVLLFCGWLILAAIYSICTIALVPFIWLYSAFIWLRTK